MPYTTLFGRGFRLGQMPVKPLEAQPMGDKSQAGQRVVNSAAGGSATPGSAGGGFRGAFMRKNLPRTLQIIGAAMQDINGQGHLAAFQGNEAEQQRLAAEEMAQAREQKVQDGENAQYDEYVNTLDPQYQPLARLDRQGFLRSQMPMSAQDRADMEFRDRQFAETQRHNRAEEGLSGARIYADQAMQQAQPWEPNTTDRSVLQGALTNGQQATEGLQALDRFQAANNRIGTGPAGQFTNYFNPDMATIRQQSSLLQTMMAPQSQGQVSNYERSLFAQSAPEAGLTGPQNQQRINNLRRLFQLRQARADFYDAYGSQMRTLRGAEQAFQQSEQFRRLTQDQNASPPPSSSSLQADIMIDANGHRITR